MNKNYFDNKISRRTFVLRTAVASLTLLSIPFLGCSTLKGKKEKERPVREFDDEEEETEQHDVFDSEREKQSELSDFLAQNGRKSKTKKSSVRRGDDFLLSDKAKEIYANTER